MAARMCPLPPANFTGPSPADVSTSWWEFFGYVCVCGPLCCVGFITNFICVVVLSYDRSRVSTSILLQILALGDNLLLVTVFMTKTLPTLARPSLGYATIGLTAYYDLMVQNMKFVNMVYDVARTFAVHMVLMITVDRCIAIYWPLRANTYCTTRGSIMAAIGIMVYCIIFNIPRIFELNPYQCWKEVMIDNVTVNVTQYTIEFSWLAFDKYYILAYYTLDNIINVILPIILITVLNCLIIRMLQRAGHTRRSMAIESRRQSHRGVTVNLVSVVTTFLVLETPTVIITMITLKDNLGAAGSTINVARGHVITDTMFTANSFVNFFVYCIVGKKFRRILCEICGCKETKTPRQQRNSTWGRTSTTNISSRFSRDSGVAAVSMTNFDKVQNHCGTNGV